MDRNLDDLRPEFRTLVDTWLTGMKLANLDHIITCTVRTDAEQAALYASGRTVTGPIRTYAKPGQSAHQYGLAIDFCIVDLGKLLDWSGDDPSWDQAIKIAQASGLESLRPMESAHLQHPGWRTIAGVT